MSSTSSTPQPLISGAPQCTASQGPPCNLLYQASLAPGSSTIYAIHPSVGSANPNCASLPPPNFSPSNAAQCATALGMGQSCDMESVSDSASAYAQGLMMSAGVANSFDASAEQGCSNMAVLYSAYQQSTDTANCILTNLSNTENTTVTQANTAIFNDCASPGETLTTTNANGTSTSITCAQQPTTTAGPCLTQGNAGVINSTIDASEQASQAIANQTQLTLQQAVGNMQNISTGEGATAQTSKSLTELQQQLSTNTVNQNIFNSTNAITTQMAQSNALVFNCASNCLPCFTQGNQADVAVNLLSATAINTAFQTAGITSDVTNLTNAQTSQSKGTEAAFGPAEAIKKLPAWAIVAIVSAVLLVIGIIAFLVHRAATNATNKAAQIAKNPQAVRALSQAAMVAA